MAVELFEHQQEALDLLVPGKILYGGVGAGKSITALAYYMKEEAIYNTHIVVITTGKKRNSLEWETEAAKFGIGTEEHCTLAGIITIDSWNNIHKYTDLEDHFFIFDEQRLTGYGSWVRSFLKIAKKNKWILLTATPGDTWLDYAPIFIANGFYRNLTDFKIQHVIYEPFVKFPKVKRYINENRLEMLRNDMLVEMPYLSNTAKMFNWWEVEYDKKKWAEVWTKRWNPYEGKPIKDAAEMGRVLRRLVNSDPSRIREIKKLLTMHPKLIVFYSFNYELEILRDLADVTTVAEWNGHKKEPIPDTESWIYLVQYVSGSEGWNCLQTDAMVLYSLPHSYKNFKQAPGRIDRLDTPFDYLYYYVFVSNSLTDLKIRESLAQKKNFNERRYIEEFEGREVCEMEEN